MHTLRLFARSMFGLSVLYLTPAFAFDFRSGQTVTIPAGEIVEDDLYVAAAEVQVEGEVRGDLIAAGSTITVRGNVAGDLIAAGRSILVSGTVGDDVRIAGAALTLEGAQIGGDLVAAGYSLDMDAGSAVAGDLSFGGAQARLAGSIDGRAITESHGLVLAGTIAGDLKAGVGEPEEIAPPSWTMGLPPVPDVPGGFSFRQGARVGGNVDVTTREPVNIAPDRVGGEVDVDVAEPRAVGASWLVRFLRRYLSLALVGLLLLWLVPVLYDRAARALERGPLASLGRGALTLVGMPLALLVALGLVILLAVILGLLTLGGLAGSVVVLGAAFLFLVGALFVLALVYLAYVVVAYAGGRWLLGRGGGSLSDNAILAFLIGLLIVVLLSFIPVVGWLVTLAVILLGLGALWQIWRARPRPPRVAPAAPA